MKKIFLGLVILFSVVFSSCLSAIFSSANSNIPENTSSPKSKVYIATGESPSLMTAINDAKIEAIRKGVIDLIGVYSEQSNADKLKNSLYNTKNPNAYVENDKMKVLQKYKTGENYFCQIQIPVKLDDLSSFLEARGIHAEVVQNNTHNLVPEKKQVKTADDVLAESKKIAEAEGHAEYLESYLDNMTYMVFSADDSSADKFLLKSAAQMANSYLVNRGYRVIGYDEIKELKKDNSIIFEESEGTNISAIQWIAQKLNADVYLEVDTVTEGGSTGGSGYYGSAKVTVKIFNPSTGEVLGSIPYSSQKTFSQVSAYDAESNALQSTIYKVLPIAEDQSKMMLAKTYSKGIRYELIINGTNDPRLMIKFKSELSKKVESVKTLNLSSQQTKYSVFNFSEVDEIASIVYEIAENLPGFENMELVVLRGKTLTFTMGN